MKNLAVLFVLTALSVGLASLVSAQTGPTFKSHRIGETAQEFFDGAKMAGTNGQSTVTYCKDYLGNPKRMQKYEKVKNNRVILLSSIDLLDVEGCLGIQRAINGEDLKVGARYAAELAPGDAEFHAGHLVSITFTAKAPFDDVVADMKTKLGAEPRYSSVTEQNAYGAGLIERQATWDLDKKLMVLVGESKSFLYGYLGTNVIVTDGAWAVQKEKIREATRPNTLD